jgi:hypothetical protein
MGGWIAQKIQYQAIFPGILIHQDGDYPALT